MATLIPRTETTPTMTMDPLDTLQRARQQLWSLMEMPFSQMIQGEAAHIALADLEETDDEFRLEIDLPGVKRKDVSVDVEGRRITVTGERRERERAGTLRRRERVTGMMRHEVLLPGDIDEDEIEATLSEGVLTVRVPKSESGRRHRIEVK